MGSTFEHPCARCARVQRTCCQRAEIVLTRGDLSRIGTAIGGDDWFTFGAPSDPGCGVPDPDDPDWVRLTVRPDGTRRVLRRRAGGDCTFLGAHGCVLGEETRPLVCRLYPLTYDARALRGVEPEYCPTALLAPRGESMVGVLGMSRARAERWRAQLYAELRAEAGEDGGQAP